MIMRRFARSVFQQFLAFLTRRVVRRYQPVIVGITGSVGKTGAKEAIFHVLSGSCNARKSEGNLNNAFGLPLAVLGGDDPKGSVWGWFRVCVRGIALLVRRDISYPEVLVLEMGADRKGDIQYLVSLAPPTIGVLTSLGSSHLEFFGSREDLIREKVHIISCLPSSGIAVLCRDDEEVWSMRSKTRAAVVGYGTHPEARVRAEYISFSRNPEQAGVSFKLAHNGSSVPVSLSGVCGMPAVLAALAGAAVGIQRGMNIMEIARRLERLSPLPGRLRVLAGIKYTWIIDDTYNASAESLFAALDVLRDMEVKGKRWAVLGDMLELGSETVHAHRMGGERVVRAGVDYLVTVGERARQIRDAAHKAGMKEDCIFSFSYARDAGKFVQDKMQKGDIVLVKGSQGVRMELVVKEIMAEPQQARKLLCRQDATWAKE